ncbi:MAG: ATP-dependent helicase, partial [Chloroflexota bacterium]
ALELRDRVSARMGGAIVPTVATFHSFAYALLRRTDDPEDYLDPPRLMSGAEEDVRIRTLLLGAVEDGAVDWPADLMGALPTLGLANEVRAVLSRARDLGLEDEALQRIGLASGRPAWAAIGQLARQEQQVMALENVMDYSELMWRAVLRAQEPPVQAILHRQYRAVFVDEYQDTDPLQVDLLKALVGPECAIVAVGDPDQAIYAFRGADVRGLEDFRTDFPAPGGGSAPVAVLRTCRRYGPVVRLAAAAVIARNRVVRGIPPEHVAAHRAPTCTETQPDDVDVRAYDDEGSLAAYVADAIRRAHVNDKVPWEQMAVLVRTGLQIPRVQRALQLAGVPVVVAADEIPLRAEAAVAVLLSALRIAIAPDRATSADVEDLLTGPLCGLGGTDLRRVGRALRAAAHSPGEATPNSTDLLRDVVIGGVTEGVAEYPLPPSDPAMAAVRAAAALLRSVRDEVRTGATPQEALWTLWTGGRAPHGWPERLRAEAIAGSRSAHHDLDAVMALFEAAERFTGRYPGFAGSQQFIDALAAQQIPAEQVSDRGVQEHAVRILTAHRAKGLEWDEVWVVGAQEGVWPDLRERGSTLRAAELGADGLVPGTNAAQLLAEERRLFYVACTRARHRLHVAVISSSGDEREQPSRFVDDL